MIEEAIAIEKEKAKSPWTKSKLGDICEVVTGKWDANHSVVNGKYRFYTCAYDYLRCDTKRFSGECLILPGNGANVGEVFYYNGDFDAYQRTYVIQHIKLVPKFLYYHLKLNWKKGTDAKQYGSATNYIRIGNFNDYEISYPSQREQQQIVSKIEELFSELDKCIEELKTAQQQLKVYRQAVLKWAFEGKLTNDDVKDGELPEGWKWVKLNEVAKKITDGEHFRPPTQETGIAFLSAKDVRDNGVSFKAPLFISEEKAKKALVRCNPEKGDILIVSRGATVGRMCIVKTDKVFCLLGSVILVKPKSELSNEFLTYILKSPQINRKLISISGATAQQAIYLRDIKEIGLVLPSLEEQQQIVQEIECRLSVCDKIEETITDSLKQAEALRQSILKKAFGGKL
jgi:type I restriction enzyme S subunit